MNHSFQKAYEISVQTIEFLRDFYRNNRIPHQGVQDLLMVVNPSKIVDAIENQTHVNLALKSLATIPLYHKHENALKELPRIANKH